MPEPAPSLEELRQEYAELGEDLRAIGGRTDAARAFGVAAIGAVLTLAIQQALPVIALAATVLVYCFARIDLVNAFRYTRFAQRAKRIELAIDAYVELERRPKDAIAEATLAARLESLGKRPYQEELNEPGPNELAFIHPHSVFKRLYPVLFVGSAAIAFMIAIREDSTGETLAVTSIAILFAALWLPSFADPSRPPLVWWEDRLEAPARRRSARAVALVAAVLMILAVYLALPALRVPPAQQPGSLSLSHDGSHGPITVALVLRPSCSASEGTLRIRWRGSAGRLLVQLPANLETRDGERRVSIRAPRSPVEVPLVVHPGEALDGRCTLALPALVGAGEASGGSTRLDLPPRFEGFSVDGSAATVGARIGPCRAAPDDPPIESCAGVLHLTEPDSSNRRLQGLVFAGGAVLLAALVVVGFFAVSLLHARRKEE